MGIVAERLEVDAEHVVFGHTHRAGPLATDADEDGWAAPGGRRLWNAGNWVYEPAVAGPPGRRSGHWPGACVVVDDDGPPRLERLLDEEAMADDRGVRGARPRLTIRIDQRRADRPRPERSRTRQ